MRIGTRDGVLLGTAGVGGALAGSTGFDSQTHAGMHASDTRSFAGGGYSGVDDAVNPHASPIVAQIVKAVEERMHATKPLMLQIPLQVTGQRHLVFKLYQGDDPREEVAAFCLRYPVFDQQWLIKVVLSRLHPDATVAG
jgi:hypothetical protein